MRNARLFRWDLSGFTLIELLVVMGIIAVLAAIILPVYGRVFESSNEVKTLSNMRQMGAAMLLYANDNNQVLPNRVSNPGDGSAPPAKWPGLLLPYLQNWLVYASPIPPAQGKSYTLTDPTKITITTSNYTSYIYNGMNDLGAFTDSTVTVRINTVSQPMQTILLGIPYPQTGQFYMDFVENGGNNNDILNKNAFGNGCPYMFCDGSARYLLNNADSTTYQRLPPPNSNTYTDWLWLFNKDDGAVIQ